MEINKSWHTLLFIKSMELFLVTHYNSKNKIDFTHTHYCNHRRRIYKEAKADCRRCFLGDNGHPHASIKTV